MAKTASLEKRAQVTGVLIATALAIGSEVVGAPVPQIQSRLLLSIVIGFCAAIGAELFTSPRGYRWSTQILAAALGVSIGLAAIRPTHKLRVLMDHRFALTANGARAFSGLGTRTTPRSTRTWGLLPCPLIAWTAPRLRLASLMPAFWRTALQQCHFLATNPVPMTAEHGSKCTGLAFH